MDLNSKELVLDQTNSELNKAKSCNNCIIKYDKIASIRLTAKNKAIRVLLDSGSSGDLLFLKKGTSKDIPVITRAVPRSWGASHDTFATDKVGDIEISFREYSNNKKVHLQPDIVECRPGLDAPMHVLIIGKNTMHKLGAVLDFYESTIQIDEILLPMRDIVGLQHKPSMTRALCANMNCAQEPVSTRSAAKIPNTKKQIFQYCQRQLSSP